MFVESPFSGEETKTEEADLSHSFVLLLCMFELAWEAYGFLLTIV